MYTKHENGDIKFVGEKMAYLINDAGTTDQPSGQKKNFFFKLDSLAQFLFLSDLKELYQMCIVSNDN